MSSQQITFLMMKHILFILVNKFYWNIKNDPKSVSDGFIANRLTIIYENVI